MIKAEFDGKKCTTEIEGRMDDVMAELAVMIYRFKKYIPESALRKIIDIALDDEIDKFLEAD